MNFWVTIKFFFFLKWLNAKLERHLARPHAFSHEVSKREIHFVTTFILQYSSKKSFFYSFLELNNYNGYVCAIHNCCFTVLLHIYSFLKVRLIFHPKKKGKIFFFFLNHETKNKYKRETGP